MLIDCCPACALRVVTMAQVPTTVEFVDIAGLVRGASKGEGLGNKFLANIRETDAICQVCVSGVWCTALAVSLSLCSCMFCSTVVCNTALILQAGRWHAGVSVCVLSLL